MAGAGGKAPARGEFACPRTLLSGVEPAAPDLKKIGPRNTITFFPRASYESFDLLGADYKDAEQSRQV
jgi:hypothetical protein